MEVYNITIQSLAVEGFSFEVECINAKKYVNLLTKPKRYRLEKPVWPIEKTELQ